MNIPVTKFPKILIVDDDSSISDALDNYLSSFLLVKVAIDGEDAMRILKDWRPDLILLDLEMPNMDGLIACKAIRNQDFTRHIPIIMITASRSIEKRKEAFNVGIDDFISKPFNLDELKIRILSKLIRHNDLLNVINDKITIGNLELNDQKKEITIEGRLIYFSPVEYNILKLLMNRAEQSVSRRRIMKRVWGDRNQDDSVIDSHVTSIRKKTLEFDGCIQTIYGVGYRLKKENNKPKNYLPSDLSKNKCDLKCLPINNGEMRHHENCSNYIGSLSELCDNKKCQILKLENMVKTLRSLL